VTKTLTRLAADCGRRGPTGASVRRAATIVRARERERVASETVTETTSKRTAARRSTVLVRTNCPSVFCSTKTRVSATITTLSSQAQLFYSAPEC